MKVTTVTPWYPNLDNPYSGVFVADLVKAMRAAGHQMDVEVIELFPTPFGGDPSKGLGFLAEVAARDVGAAYRSTAGVTYIPAPIPKGSTYGDRAGHFAQALSLKRSHIPRQGEITHAHVGLPTGGAVLNVGDTPTVVTEHFSGLRDLLKKDTFRTAYRHVITRSRAFTCVSPVIEQWIEEALGGQITERIRTVPNVVAFDRLEFVRPERQAARKWVYVGGLHEHKGVPKTIKAFYEFTERIDPHGTLTLVGDGPLRSSLHRLLASLDLEDRVHFAGRVDPAVVGQIVAEADVMVHLSPLETFGLSSIESIAVGTPVVSLANGGSDWTWGPIADQVGRLLRAEAEPEEVADAVAQLPDQQLDLLGGRLWLEQRFGAQSISRQWQSIYEEALSG